MLNYWVPMLIFKRIQRRNSFGWQQRTIEEDWEDNGKENDEPGKKGRIFIDMVTMLWRNKKFHIEKHGYRS